ncbi:hypothetical protein [Phenylobacterium sp.]|uniref:hypothetical protein n=1 Tax=Phenylobacterium sp. TaxID=1871053 RepID=UPI0035B0C259
MAVQPIMDLRGASGAIYRFRLAQPDALPNAAGNFVCLVAAQDGDRVVTCGATTSLATAAAAWKAAARDGATHLFIRLNVARQVRTVEHDDLVSALSPARVISDPG